MLPQRCYEEHIVLLYTNTQCTPHCACCQTPFFQITLYSVRDPGSPNPARQMQNSLVEAALTGAISTDLSNQRDNANNYGVVVNRVWICPIAHDGTGYYRAFFATEAGEWHFGKGEGMRYGKYVVALYRRSLLDFYVHIH